MEDCLDLPLSFAGLKFASHRAIEEPVGMLISIIPSGTNDTLSP
jgi:hypothetical protein